MTWRWFRKDQTQSQAETLFEALNAAARSPALYAAAGAPDTIEGRFEVLGLHIFLALRRLRRDAPASDRLSIALQEIFFRRLDGALREIGVGDLSIGRKIRGLAEAFYGRAAAYERAMGEGPDALAAALARNVIESGDAGRARLLAEYVLKADLRLASAQADGLVDAIKDLMPLSEAVTAKNGDDQRRKPD
ncbi:MAG TPA: ubiquinol-cytochrome C chaperone [Parvularcula sp.]|nr:ubiquinol-cytochrome C chaperone [Parvularcula sp.]HBS31054.1 ubiquinol-cytochrome C chaperone [Parvularcula sp.]HBS35036.1 ubiquinol-cytochrome C chaperone [Parvularcula sp.]